MSTATTLGRRRFNGDLKLQAVRLVREQKLPVVQVCREFNISSSSLHRWLSQYDAECDGRTGSGAPITPSAPNRAWVCDITYGTPSQRSPPVWG